MTGPRTVAGEADGDRLLQLVFATGLIAFAGGTYVLAGTDIGADVSAALAAVAGQLPGTIGPALMIAVLAALVIASGAVLIRFVAGSPFEGWSQAIMAGFAGAVVVDTVLMAVLGAFGLFRWPVLVAAHLVLLGGGLWLRPIFAGRGLPAARLPALGPVGWLLVGCVWIAPVLLQLASPVVPSNDVGPNHIAPVEHLRAFGALSSLDLVVSPVYGPSRIFLGYQGLLGALATMGNIEGATAVSAFIMPLAILLAVSGSALAAIMGGRRGAAFALLLIPLTVPFLRLTDARATVLAIPLVVATMVLLLAPIGATSRRRAAVLAVVMAASLYAHPLVGLFNVGTVLLAVTIWPRRYANDALPAAIAALIAATPQWTAMLGMPFAGATAIVALPLAAALILWLTARPIEWTLSRRTLVLIVALVSIFGLAVANLVPTILADPSRLGESIASALSLIGDYGVLVLAAAVGTTTVLLLRGPPRAAKGIALMFSGVLVGALGTWAGALAADFIGPVAALDYEIAKTATYFAPTALAIAGAAGLAVMWSRSDWPLMLRTVVMLAIVVLAAAPLRPALVERMSLGEHRLSETASISLRIAAEGYWRGFPDPRWVVDADQREIIDFLRDEIAAGRLIETSQVLQVTESWRADAAPAYAMSLSAFAGVVETIAAYDGPRASDTVGGRMMDLADLGSILHERFAYIVAQTRGLAPEILATIEDRGYEVVFSNSAADVFRLAE